VAVLVQLGTYLRRYSFPKAKAAPEMAMSAALRPKKRRTEGRAEDRATLEEQLTEGLEDTFPASDAVSVVSTLIAGRAKKLAGTDIALRRRTRDRGKERNGQGSNARTRSSPLRR
jgi:hypothetical protein